MLKELSKYNNVGNLREIYYIVNDILNTEKSTLEQIKKSCFYNSGYILNNIEGILALLKFCNLVIEEKDKYKLNDAISKSMYKDKPMLKQKIINEILVYLRNSLSTEIFDYEKVKYDLVLGMYILNSSIPLKYSVFRNILIELDFFNISKINSNILIINKEYEEFVKEIILNYRRKISLEELKIQLDIREKNGHEAELYVLNYEEKRLANRKIKKPIVHISQLDVTAGYDIASFDNEDSRNYDRFIEVKSFNKSLSFHWSKNEIEISKLKLNNYYLYLVDRSQINNKTYKPTIIRNPYEEIYLNSIWIKESESYYVYKI